MKHLTKLELKWGVIFTLITLLWMVFERLMGWHDVNISQHATRTNLFAIVAIAVYVFALLDKRKTAYDGKMTWTQGFLAGLMISIVVAILSPFSQLITHFVITPDYFNNAIEYAVNEMGKNRAEMEEYFNLTSYIMYSTIFAVIVGAVTSAIVALFVKKK